MLSPDQRELLLNALRPPDGYRFDRGVGTTFSLDLLTLLIAPLSLALLDISDAEEALRDPVLLLDSLRQYADRLTIFCQAGRIAIPRTASHLYRFLEGMVVEVQAPGGGVFHPKVWLLRYLAHGEAPFYRFLCLTRNLTFDKSWDLMLRLEGRLAQRKRAHARNHPLGDFIQTLPTLATHPVSRRVAEDIALLQEEVRRVAFEPPYPFEDDLAFHPIGIPDYERFRFNLPCRRMLVIAPFLDDAFLTRATERGADHILVSRMDALDTLSPKVRNRFAKLYVLDESASEETEDDATNELGGEIPGVRTEPSGLHAKLFVLDAGWYSTWLLGSANATSAAFRGKNIEFMVKLRGLKSKVGIDKILGFKDDGLSLHALLRTYSPPDRYELPDKDQLAVEELADKVRAWLIASGLRLEVVEKDGNRFDLIMRPTDTDQVPPKGDYSITCWLVSLRRKQGISIEASPPGDRVEFHNLSLLSLTPFIAFEVVAHRREKKRVLRFVLNLPVSSMPESRDDHLLSAIISDRTQFLRYLRLILAEEKNLIGGYAGWLIPDGSESASPVMYSELDVPLLEQLVRALSRSPEKIDRIAELVERLRRTPEGRAVLPDGFDTLWEIVLHTRETGDDAQLECSTRR
jgi:hypothetical protein